MNLNNFNFGFEPSCQVWKNPITTKKIAYQAAPNTVYTRSLSKDAVYPSKVEPFKMKLGDISSASNADVSQTSLINNLNRITERDAYEITFSATEDRPVFQSKRINDIGTIEIGDFDSIM